MYIDSSKHYKECLKDIKTDLNNWRKVSWGLFCGSIFMTWFLDANTSAALWFGALLFIANYVRSDIIYKKLEDGKKEYLERLQRAGAGLEKIEAEEKACDSAWMQGVLGRL